MSKLRNLTPHPIRIADQDGNIVRELPSEGVLRLGSSRRLIDVVDGIPIQSSSFSIPEDIERPGKDEYFIVSAPAAAAIKDPRYIAPDTGYTAIKEGGRVVAVRGFLSFGEVVR